MHLNSRCLQMCMYKEGSTAEECEFSSPSTSLGKTNDKTFFSFSRVVMFPHFEICFWHFCFHFNTMEIKIFEKKCIKMQQPGVKRRQDYQQTHKWEAWKHVFLYFEWTDPLIFGLFLKADSSRETLRTSRFKVVWSWAYRQTNESIVLHPQQLLLINLAEVWGSLRRRINPHHVSDRCHMIHSELKTPDWLQFQKGMTDWLSSSRPVRKAIEHLGAEESSSGCSASGNERKQPGKLNSHSMARFP